MTIYSTIYMLIFFVFLTLFEILNNKFLNKNGSFSVSSFCLFPSHAASVILQHENSH